MLISFTLLLSLVCSVLASKRAMLFPWDSNPADFSQFNHQNCPTAVFYANWESWPHSNVPSNLEFIAMARTQNDIGKLYQYMPNNGARWLALLNEPDLEGPTQLDVGTAVNLWRQHAVHFRDTLGVKLLSPSITSDQSKGLPWLRSFIAATRDCPPNAISLHYYGTSGSDFKKYVQKVYNEFRLPIMIHEVASTDTYIQSVQGFMGDIMSWVDQQPWIIAVFWFSASRNANIKENLALSALLDQNGHRTDLAFRYCWN